MLLGSEMSQWLIIIMKLQSQSLVLLTCFHSSLVGIPGTTAEFAASRILWLGVYEH